jgi:hypothetical protein
MYSHASDSIHYNNYICSPPPPTSPCPSLFDLTGMRGGVHLQSIFKHSKFTNTSAFFKKVIDSQKAYAKKVMKYLLMNQPNYKLAYENEFGPIGKVKI